tara:strand:+ start:4469 stop:4960 length:492 start_codon:yes stop_codon:yes gene_type:complete
MAGVKKYRPEFCQQLKDGLRRHHKMTIQKMCQGWGVSVATYTNWKDKYPEFKKASQIGEQDYYVACVDFGWDMAEGAFKGNAGVYCMLMSALHGMSQKTEQKVTHEEQIKTININVISKSGDSVKQPLIIDQVPEKIKISPLEKLILKNEKKKRDKVIIENGK